MDVTKTRSYSFDEVVIDCSGERTFLLNFSFLLIKEESKPLLLLSKEWDIFCLLE